MTSGWGRVRQIMSERLAAGKPVSFRTWRAVVVAAADDLARQGLDDPVLRYVAQVAAAARDTVAGAPLGGDTAVVDAVRRAVAESPGVDRPAVEEVRAALLLATHVSSRSVTLEWQERVLDAVMRELLPTPGVELTVPRVALREWQHAVASFHDGMSPQGAAWLAMVQSTLLARTSRWIRQVETSPGVDLERLAIGVWNAETAWRTAQKAWASARVLAPGIGAGEVAMNQAWVGVVAALRREKSPAVWIAAMIDSGFAGSLTAALAIRAPSELESLLTRVGTELEILADPLHGITLRDIPHPHAELPAKQPRAATPPPSSSSLSVGREVPSLRAKSEPRREDAIVEVSREGSGPEGWREMAAMRDAGVIAAAALAGDPAATRLTAEVPSERLEQLVAQGQAAIAQLVTWSQPLAEAAIARIGYRNQDIRQDVMEAITKAAHEFDPARAGLSTYMYQQARWAVMHHLKTLGREPTLEGLVSDEQVRDGEALAAGKTRSAETEAIRSVEMTRLITHIRQLPELEQRILTARFGLKGQAPATQASVGCELGISAKSVAKLERAALAKLRGAPQQPTPTQTVSMSQLAVELQRAAPKELVVQLRRNLEQRHKLQQPRPLIDTIRETAKRQHRSLKMRPEPARNRGEEGLER